MAFLVPVNKEVVHAHHDKSDDTEQPLLWIDELRQTAYHQTGEYDGEIPVPRPIWASKRFVAFRSVEQLDIPHGAHIGNDEYWSDEVDHSVLVYDVIIMQNYIIIRYFCGLMEKTIEFVSCVHIFSKFARLM